MLSKRSNILFPQQMWDQLMEIAEINRVSVGELIRRAVTERYFSDSNPFRHRVEAYEQIIKLRKRQKGQINYRELIDHGRKY